MSKLVTDTGAIRHRITIEVDEDLYERLHEVVEEQRAAGSKLKLSGLLRWCIKTAKLDKVPEVF